MPFRFPDSADQTASNARTVRPLLIAAMSCCVAIVAGCCCPAPQPICCCKHCPRPCQVSDQFIWIQYQIPPAFASCGGFVDYGAPVAVEGIQPSPPAMSNDAVTGGSIAPGLADENYLDTLFSGAAPNALTVGDVLTIPGWSPTSEEPAPAPTAIGTDQELQVNDHPIPRLRAIATGSDKGTPAMNSVLKKEDSSARIVPEPSLDTLPATGPELEPRVWPGFPGIPAPESNSLEPRSAQPEPTSSLR